jgi:glycosyltransferase involved in cell wall biosynthesis
VSLDISIIICAHNSRPDYLKRVFEALKAQTLPQSQWEMLVIDNASKEPMAAKWDIAWHPLGRHVREDELGLVPARLRGISESKGSLLIFVDDDNVLQPDYLQEALRISSQWPQLGAWGGNVEAEFEQNPEPELMPLVPLLAIRKIDKVQWSNQSSVHNHALPIGAGMCIRKVVAEKYAEAIKGDRQRKLFDRKGTSLASSGDTDLALASCDLGYGTGLFPALKVTHLIPRNRVQREYLLRLEEEVVFGHLLLGSIRGTPVDRIAMTERLLNWYALLRHSGIKRSVIRARWNARLRHVKITDASKNSGTTL